MMWWVGGGLVSFIAPHYINIVILISVACCIFQNCCCCCFGQGGMENGGSAVAAPKREQKKQEVILLFCLSMRSVLSIYWLGCSNTAVGVTQESRSFLILSTNLVVEHLHRRVDYVGANVVHLTLTTG